MNEENDTPYEVLLGVCENNSAALASLALQVRGLRASNAALRLVVQVLAIRSQLPAEDGVSLLEKLEAAFHQRQLEALEDENPAAAARADTRQGIPDLDPDLMELLRRACEEGGDRGHEE
jgi:hypothetical protein